MCASSAEVKAANGTAVAGMPEQRAHREQLVECELAMKHVSATGSNVSLQLERRHDVGRYDERPNAGSIAVECLQSVCEQQVCRLPGVCASRGDRRVVNVDG